MAEGIMSACFVCGKLLEGESKILNREVNLPVCVECSGTEKEKETAKKHLESLAEGFVCGCI